MYDSIMLTLILITLLWIAAGLQLIASSIQLLGRLIPTRRNVRALERDLNTMPWMAKIVAMKVASYVLIRYIGKKMR